jgi:hypothetical protein
VPDCLGALKRVTFLPSHRIPSQCCHSNILKLILVHCRGLSFTTYYSHIKAHQEDNALFDKLSRQAQLNCICDHAAKQRLVTNGMEDIPQGGLFPLELVGVFVGTKKMTLDTGADIQFWAHRKLAKNFYCDQKILTNTQFECIDWESVHRTLHNLPRLFQIWAAKQVLGVTGMMKFLSHQDGEVLYALAARNALKLVLILLGAQRLGEVRRSTSPRRKSNDGSVKKRPTLICSHSSFCTSVDKEQRHASNAHSNFISR